MALDALDTAEPEPSVISTLLGFIAGGAVLFAAPHAPRRPQLSFEQLAYTHPHRWTAPGTAGLAGAAGVVIFFGTKSLLTAGVGIAIVMGIPLLLASARSEAERRRERNAMPETLEVLAMAISAGMTIDRSVDFIVRCGPDPARAAFEAVARQLAAGSTRRAALTSLAEQSEGLYSPLVEVLLAAERDGAPVALVLDRLANEATRAYRNTAEERAKRTPVLLLAPLMICSLPAVLIGSVVPFVVLTLGQTPF